MVGENGVKRKARRADVPSTGVPPRRDSHTRRQNRIFLSTRIPDGQGKMRRDKRPAALEGAVRDARSRPEQALFFAGSGILRPVSGRAVNPAAAGWQFPGYGLAGRAPPSQPRKSCVCHRKEAGWPPFQRTIRARRIFSSSGSCAARILSASSPENLLRSMRRER